MRIGIDMDEVLYCWERTARYLIRNVYVGPLDEYDLSKPFTEWDVDKQVGQEAYNWLFDPKGGIKAGLFRHGHVVTGAMLGVRWLKREGHELVIVTHRPETGVQDTLAWIDFHFGKEDPYPWSGVNILSGGQPKTNVDWDLIIDDSIANANAAQEAGRAAIVFGAAWNQGDITWDDIPGLIRFQESIRDH